jgi:ABC-type branched-subunit amino acid transport system ATPase component
LEFVGLRSEEATKAADLSFGQQKLLVVARMLASESTVLLLDEPATGVSPALLPTLVLLLRRIVESGKTVILIEHNIAFVKEVADTVHFLHEGRVMRSGEPEHILSDLEVRRIYVGM